MNRGIALLTLLAFSGLLIAQDAPKAAEPKKAEATPASPPPLEYTSPVTKHAKEKAKDGTEVVKNPIDGGDTAWMLVSTGLVMLMVPGLALFYGGLVRRKNLLGTMMHSMVALGIIGVQWILFGYAIAFGQSVGGWYGWSPELVGLQGILSNDTFSTTKIPLYVHCMYQGMFAIITPALISGAIAERVKFGAYCLFILIWSTIVYCPLAHWVWALNGKGESVGFIGQMGAIDFAGGTVVHVAAGVGALAAILALRSRIGYPKHAMHPNSVVLSLVGAGLLWFGWFGFNGGSGLGTGAWAGSALTATQVAAAGAALGWSLIEWCHRGKPTGLGFATGLVAGLVAVTPASGYVTPLSALIIGFAAAAVCYGFVVAKPALGYDDSLDAFGVHGVGGALGAVLTGVFASASLYTASSGLSFLGADGTPDTTYALANLGKDGSDRMALVMAQLKATGIAAIFSFVLTYILVKAIDVTIGFTLSTSDEHLGLDRSEHGEVGFDYGTGATVDDIPESTSEPKSATVPPNGKGRFTVVVEGASDKDLMAAWSKLCQVGVTHPAEFKAIYPLLTTVKGNRFQFRGGDQFSVRGNLKRLFEATLNTTVQTHVEE